MQHLEEVRAVHGVEHWLWRTKGLLGFTVEWKAEIVEDRPGERIAWRSLEGSEVPNSGYVQFTPAPQGGTEIRVEIRYEPPAGKLGAAVAKLFGADPERQIADDLRRFKQMLELGEVLLSDASVHRGPHPARPSDTVPAKPAQLIPQITRVIS